MSLPILALLVSTAIFLVSLACLFGSDLLDRLRPTRRASTEVLRGLALWDDSGYPINAAARELARREQIREARL